MADRDQNIRLLRAFNRTYTSRLGLLNAHLDRSAFTLSEARILYEVHHGDGVIAADIARKTCIDRGQLSRTIKRLEQRGLVRAKKGIGRSQALALTASGETAFTGLERRTNGAVGDLLDELPVDQRDRLLASAKTITLLFGTAPETTCRVRGLEVGDAGWVIHRQALTYAREYGFNVEYEGLIAGILSDFISSFNPAREAAWIAEVDSTPVGSIFLVAGDEPSVGKLRLLYVDADFRGRGIGKQLIDLCVHRARDVGYEKLVLWTQSVLVQARHLYEQAGFTLVEEEAHHSFGKQLVGQNWSLDLKSTEAR